MKFPMTFPLLGIAAGADDYLVKPFSAKELLTRVSARLELARVRASASKKEQQLREEAQRANKLKVRKKEKRSAGREKERREGRKINQMFGKEDRK